MKVLIVYAHPEPKSFNHAMKETAVQTLQDQGHEVIVSDLYAMHFDPVASKADFNDLENPDFFKYAKEQKHAFDNDTLSDAIKAEYDKLIAADFVIFQFPLWWFSMPAIMKGWVDKVFLFGGIYGGNYGRYNKAALAGKKAMLSLTTGSPEGSYKENGFSGEIHEHILYHINHGMLYFSGMQPIEPTIAYTVSHSQDERERYLKEYAAKLSNIDAIPLIHYPRLDEYDDNGQLKKRT